MPLGFSRFEGIFISPHPTDLQSTQEEDGGRSDGRKQKTTKKTRILRTGAGIGMVFKTCVSTRWEPIETLKKIQLRETYDLRH
jgi:hypothetical protein